MSFAHYKKRDVDPTRTIRVDLVELEDPKTGTYPVLICKPGTQANRPYFNEVLKRNGKAAKRLRGGNMTAAMLDKSRAEDAELYPKHVIVGWENVVNENLEPVPFSPDVCRLFLESIPDWVFDGVRNEVANPAAFVDFDTPTDDESDALGKS